MSKVFVPSCFIIENVVFTFDVNHHVLVDSWCTWNLTWLIVQKLLVLRIQMVVASKCVLISQLGINLDPFRLN